MKKSKDELNRIQKKKCRELKEIRAKIADNLGIELHQRECTYEGFCSGTCPACRQEEIRLNTALLKKQMQEVNLKGRVAAAGLAAAASLCLTGCSPSDQNMTEGAIMENTDGYITPETSECDAVPPDEPLENNGSLLPENRPEGNAAPDEMLEGRLENTAPPSCETEELYMELEGDFETIPESDRQENDDAV